MDAAALRAIQAPIKERYKTNPSDAYITLTARGTLDDRPAIAQGSQVMDVRELSAGDIQFDGRGSRCDQQRSILEATAVVQFDGAAVGIDPQDAAAREQIDPSV